MRAADRADDAPEGSALALLPPALPLLAAPVGGPAAQVQAWFDAAADALSPVLDGTLAAEREAAAVFQRMAKAANTRIAYRAAVRAWCAWCDRRGVPALPAAGPDVATFLAANAAAASRPTRSTCGGRRSATSTAPPAARCRPTMPASPRTVAGIRRHAASRGELPAKKVAATAAIIRQILAPMPDDLRGKRDRALILTGFAGALRRAELAAVRAEHLEKTEHGLRLTLPQTKGSQTDAVIVPLPYGQTELCPVRALASWQAAADITAGPVFRRIWLPRQAKPGQPPPLPRIGTIALTPWAVAAIVKRRAAAAGFASDDFGGHSLKRGALTTGMERGAHPADLRRLGRHKSFDVLGEYLEFGNLFDRHPLGGVL